MLWKEIPNQDPSKTWLFYIQNFAKTPNAYVHLYIATDGEEPSSQDQPQQTLIALQVLRIYIQPNSKVYFAEENGGVCTAIKTEKIPFVNYDVPIYHRNIPLNTEYRFTAPEGSEIVFQNFSGDGDCFINIGGGDGWIRATRYATLIDSFHDDTEITIKGETGTEVISIIQKQSIAVTQLSDENIDLLEDLLTRVEMIENNYVNTTQLDEVRKRTYLSLYSPYSEVIKYMTNNIQTKTFKSNIEEYRSKLYDNVVLNVVNIFNFTYDDNEITDSISGYLSFDILVSDNLVDSVLNIYTDNQFIKENLKEIKLNRNRSKDQLNFEFIFNNTIQSIKVDTCIRAEEVSSSVIDDVLVIDNTTLYSIDLFNGDIVFTDNEFFLKLLEPYELLTIPPHRLSRYKIDRGVTMVQNNPINNYNVYTIQDNSCIIKYYEPFETDLYSPRIELEIPKDVRIKSILGFMLIPQDEYINDQNMKSITINLAACLSAKQTQTSAGSTLKVTFPIYCSELQGVDYLSIYKNITLDLLNKSELYLIIQEGD